MQDISELWGQFALFDEHQVSAEKISGQSLRIIFVISASHDYHGG